jgi:hypothetical protein
VSDGSVSRGPIPLGTVSRGAASGAAVPLGRAGLIASAVSVAGTFTVAVLGPSVTEPALPGAAGRPPWAFAARPPAGLAVGLTALALAAGALGVGLGLGALHRGWTARPRPVLLGGILAAAALALVPPFGSSDQLSYAAYGRMVVTGHDPYTTTPAMLARLGDPVARAVQDWRGSPSVYGSLASGLQALASAAGGTSARLTVFVLSLLNVAAFVATGLLLHRLARGSQAGQLRAALLWTCNPVLLQVLVAGAHVDSQAIVFAVAAVAAFCLGLRGAAVRAGPWRQFAVCAAAGALAGLGAAVKVTMVLVLAGLLAATVLAAGRFLLARAAGLVAGFVVIAALALVPWGPGSLQPVVRAGSMVSVGSPWRTVRLLIRLGAGEGIADDAVRAAAVLLAALLVGLLMSALAGRTPGPGGWIRSGWCLRPAGLDALALVCVFAFVFGWLMAWPYVLPWYDGLGWALLALLPLPALRLAAPGLAAPGGGPAPAGPAPAGPWAGSWVGRPACLVVALDWLMLARTTALGFGYLPARGISRPSDVAWLRPVFRNAVTPLVLLTLLVILVLLLLRRPGRSSSRGKGGFAVGGDPG